MRTTLTLDDDVARALERVRRAGKRTFKEVVNEVLRRGLQERPRAAKRPRFQTREVDLGKCRLPSLDNIAEVLSVAEGEAFR